MDGPRFAPDLVEEAVFYALRCRSDQDLASSWEAEREAVYGKPAEERDSAFAELAYSWWDRLDLAKPFWQVLALCPHLHASPVDLQVRRVRRNREEGSELFDSEDQAAPLAVLRMVVQRFEEPEELPLFLLEELLALEDMLDPAFGYRRTLPPSVEAEPQLREEIRRRFRELWRLRRAGRARRLLGRPEPAPAPTPSFLRAFHLDEGDGSAAEIASAAWNGPLASFAALLERSGCPGLHEEALSQRPERRGAGG